MNKTVFGVLVGGGLGLIDGLSAWMSPEARPMVVQALTEDAALRSVELFHRARQAGYTGGKSALYAVGADRAPAPGHPAGPV